MAWLFERMIELAAWVAFIIGIAFLVSAIVFFVQGVSLWWNENTAEVPDALVQASLSASWFVLAALAVGALACIDRYVFDLPEPPTEK
jgi:H+/Cl- antiporter ClcA